MKTYVLDASALLRYLENEPGAIRVEQLLNEARLGNCHLHMSAVNWGEVSYVLRRKFSGSDAEAIVGRLRLLPITVAAAAMLDAEEAAAMKRQYAMPYADAFAAALAAQRSATLVTADHDLRACAHALKVEFLPTRASGSKR